MSGVDRTPEGDATELASTASGDAASARGGGPGPGGRVDRYVLGAVLGVGGMGIVYRARDPELGRDVALKLVQPEAALGREGQARLLREAQVMARLAHPNTVTIFDVGVAGDQVFIAMELIDGVDMSVWLRERPRPWREVLRVMLQAGRGLEAAHQAGLVHRDFKPANVLIGRDGRARVVDLGLARPAIEPPVAPAGALADTDPGVATPVDGALTQAGVVLGTPLYMAPEQHLAGRVDARADQYSFCVALYEGLHGVRPFTGETRAELVSRILRGEVTRPPGDRPVPRWLQKVVRRGLSAGRDERYKDMAALLDALERGPRAARRRWAAGIGGVAVAGGLALWLARGEPPPTTQSAVASAGPRFAGEQRQVTFTGDADTPRLSPDGRRIAFSSGGFPNNRVVVQELASGRTRTVAWWLAVYDLDWSPDGAQLLVAASPGVFVVPSDGGERRHLTDPAALVAWSGDGAAFAGLRRGKDVFVYDLAGDVERPLALDLPSTAVVGLDWSPERNLLLLLTSEASGFAVWTVQPDGGALRRVHTDNRSARAHEPRWLGPDRFAYGRALADGAALTEFRLGADGLAEELGPMLSADDAESDYSFSGAGDRLAYGRMRPDRNVVRIDVDGEAVTTRRLTTGTQYRSSLAVSPDGVNLAFVMGPLWEADHIFVMPLAGGMPRRLTSEAAALESLAWSADGRGIYFTETIGGEIRLARIDVASGSIDAVASDGFGLIGEVVPGPGRELLVRSRDGGRLERLDPITGAHRPVLPEVRHEAINLPIVSPDGARVLVSWYREADRGSLAIFPFAGGAPTEVLAGYHRPIGWSADGSAVYAMEASFRRILAVPIGGGEPRTLAELPGELAIQVPNHIPGTTSFVSIDFRDQTEIWLAGDLPDDAVAAMATPASDPDIPPGHWAPANPAPTNLDFEFDAPGRPPSGWHLSEAARHRATAVVDDAQPFAGGRSVRVTPGARGATMLVQYVPAAAYRGRRVRVQAALRSEATVADGGVRLWLELEYLLGDPRAGELVTAATWTMRTLELDVPRDAEWLTFGAEVVGRGAADIDAFELAVVDAD